jgi:hypothetical protein
LTNSPFSGSDNFEATFEDADIETLLELSESLGRFLASRGLKEGEDVVDMVGI